MSLSRILTVARSALMAHQRAMNVTANNIANAQTPGYTRQRLVLEAGGVASGFGFPYGGGVDASRIARIRDPFLDGAYRRESGFLGSAGTTQFYLGQVEAAMNEPSDTGVAAALDNLFQAFGDLANDPSGSVNREGVRSAAQRFAYLMRRLDGAINDTLDQTVDSMRQQVDEVNSLTEKIAWLNERIAGGEKATGGDAGLRDQRDLLLDELSSILPVEVTELEDGSMAVSTDGATLVSGGTARPLEVVGSTEEGYGVAIEGSTDLLPLKSGSLKALSDLASTTLPQYLSRLDQLARAVVEQVNAIHGQGYTLDGRTGVDFFNADGVTAGTIAVADGILKSTDSIAAGDGPDVGNNRVALQLAGLGGQHIDNLGGVTFADFYSGFAATVGRSSMDAQQDATTAQALVDRADALRASVAGVSIDEEMVNLVSQQEAYTAAARLVNTADQMIQEILQIGY